MSYLENFMYAVLTVIIIIAFVFIYYIYQWSSLVLDITYNTIEMAEPGSGKKMIASMEGKLKPDLFFNNNGRVQMELQIQKDNEAVSPHAENAVTVSDDTKNIPVKENNIPSVSGFMTDVISNAKFGRDNVFNSYEMHNLHF